MADLEKQLWDSDDSSPLTHEAARQIERLNWTIGSLRSRAEAAEAEGKRLSLIVESLMDELSLRGEKIVELDREVRRLRGMTPEALARVLFEDLKRQYDASRSFGIYWLDGAAGMTDVEMEGHVDLVALAQVAISEMKEPS